MKFQGALRRWPANYFLGDLRRSSGARSSPRAFTAPDEIVAQLATPKTRHRHLRESPPRPHGHVPSHNHLVTPEPNHESTCQPSPMAVRQLSR
jgi:hypothetical protein